MGGKKSILSLVSWILCIILISNGILVYADSNKTDIKGYDYPVKLGTLGWNQMESKIERLAACQIPADTLKNLTTDELIETVLDYPFLTDIFYFDSYQQGFELVSENFNGLKELLSRIDAPAKLLKKYRQTQVITKIDKNDYKEVFDLFNLEIILRQNEIVTKFNDTELKELEKEFESKYLKKKENSDIYGLTLTASYKILAEQQRIIIGDGNQTVVYTPNGTPVVVTIEGEKLTAEDKAGCEAEIMALARDKYPSIVILRPATTNYNCHSYAWYNQNTTNRYWMSDPSAYMTDGSYNMRSNGPCVNDKVYYGSSGYLHSGIVTGVSAANNFTVTSKWGYYNLVSHKYTECPYYYPSTPLSYYYR